MHPINTNNTFECLGRHERIFEVGDEYHMLLKEVGNDPLCMNPQERVATKCSHYDELPLIDRTKAELIGNIKSDGVDMSVAKGKRVSELHYTTR